jgi:hypothetical protein
MAGDFFTSLKMKDGIRRLFACLSEVRMNWKVFPKNGKVFETPGHGSETYGTAARASQPLPDARKYLEMIS